MSEGRNGSGDLDTRQVALIVATFIVGTALITGSFVYTDHRRDVYEKDMQPYDAAVDLVVQVNENEFLRAVDFDGRDYDYVVLSKLALEWYADHPGLFEENITSTLHYRITIDDLDIPDEMHHPSMNHSSYYVFGETPPRGAGTVVLTVQYALHLRTRTTPTIYIGDFRHVGQMMVEVWE